MTPTHIALIAIPCLSAFAGMVWWFFRAPGESGAEAERPAKYGNASPNFQTRTLKENSTMNAVTKTQPAGEVADYGACLMDVIARAASDPNVDIDKMERLIAMQERVEARQADSAFTAAKLAMRPMLPVIDQRGRITIKDKTNPDKIIQETKFARFEDIHAAVTPILTDFGFDVTFKNGLSPDGKVRVTTILKHAGGHSEDTYFDLPHDSSGSKNAVQAVGSSTSYAKRYGMLSILNIRVAGEDDDATTAFGEAAISVKQYDELQRLIISTQSDVERFEKYLIGAKRLKVGERLEDLPARHFQEAKDALMLKAGKPAK